MPKFNLSIPSPCHERWEQMTPAEQGRFCSSCQKTVIDFTHMTDQQLAAYFKTHKANACGRFRQDQLHRDIVVPAKRIPWLRYFFQFTLPAFLVSLKATGQKEGHVEKISVVKGSIDTLIKDAKQEAPRMNTISGQVRDDKGNSIPFATVMIKGTDKGVSCDSDGKFALPYQQLPFTLYISSVGFESLLYEVTETSPNEIVLPAMQAALMGEVVVVGGFFRSKKPRKAVPLISTTRRDTAFNQFSVYPNPARSNGTITIDCKKMAKGYYQLQILSVDGRPVCTKQLELEQKGGLIRTDLPSLTAGQYMLTLMHTSSKKVYTEKIQVL